MKPRCRVGDLCVIIHGLNSGKYVTIIEAGDPSIQSQGWDWLAVSNGNLIDRMAGNFYLKLIPAGSRVFWSDCCLYPIRDQPGDDEMIVKAGKPRENVSPTTPKETKCPNPNE